MWQRGHQQIHIVEVQEDDERDQDADTGTPDHGGKEQEGHQPAPPGLKIEGGETMVVFLFKEGAIGNHDKGSECHKEGAEDTIRSSFKL